MKIKFNPNYEKSGCIFSIILYASNVFLILTIIMLFVPDIYKYEYVGDITKHLQEYTYIDPETHDVQKFFEYVEYNDANGNIRTSYDTPDLWIPKMEESEWQCAYRIRYVFLIPAFWGMFCSIGFFISFIGMMLEADYTKKPIVMENDFSLKNFIGK